MFEGAGAESLCCKPETTGYAIEGGASANLAPVNPAPDSALANARTVPFPMVDPYGPVNKARVPVPGYNAWPGRYNRLGRRYYGLGGLGVANTPARIAAKGLALKKAVNSQKGFAGMGLLFDPLRTYGLEIERQIGAPPVYSTSPPIAAPSTSGGGINWDTFFGGLFKTLPGTISAVTGRGDPILRQGVALPPSYPQYGVAPEGYSYNSSGQLVKDAVGSVTDFVSNNPLLVGGAILAGVLLFMRPPGRR